MATTGVQHVQPETEAEQRRANVNKLVGAAIKSALKNRNLNQADLAIYIGVDPSNISRRLSGGIEITAAEVFLAAEFLRRPVGHLYTDPDTWGPPTESLNVRVPASQGSFLLPDASPAFDFRRSVPGIFGLAS